MPDLLQTLPDWAQTLGYPAAAAAFFVAIVLVWQAGVRSGQRRLTPAADRTERLKDRALFAAAILAGLTVYLGFVIGSYQGLTAFARDFVGWADWKQNIVPVTLDGGGAAFGFLAFRAVARGKAPYACYAIVWLSAAAGAGFNFLQGGEHHRWQAGAYLAYLSVVSMGMFHTFLEQFKEGARLVIRERPSFGIRWFTYPSNTVCAALAWINYPPIEGTKPSVANAVLHLESVRADKRASRYSVDVQRATAMPWWAVAWPWLQARVLRAAITSADAFAEAERQELAERMQIVLAEHADQLAAERAEQAEMRARFEQQIAEHTEAAVRARAEVERQLRADHAVHVQSLSAEQSAGRADLGARLRAADAERSELARRATDAERHAASTSEHLTRVVAERDAERSRADRTDAALRALRVDHDGCSDWALQIDQMAAEHTEQLRALHAQHAEHLASALAERRPTTTRSAPATRRAERPGTARNASSTGHPTVRSEEDRLALVLAEDPDPLREWSDRALAKAARMGFNTERIAQLRERLAEHHAQTATERPTQSAPREMEHAA